MDAVFAVLNKHPRQCASYDLLNHKNRMHCSRLGLSERKKNAYLHFTLSLATLAAKRVQETVTSFSTHDSI